MTIKRTTDPAAEPVTTTQFEEKVILSSGFDTNKVTLQLVAAREKLEKDVDTSLITQDWTMKLTGWPKGSNIYLPKGPVQSVTSMTYLDSNGDSQTLTENTDFKLDTNGPWGVITTLDSWPSLYEYGDAITIVYVTGYGNAATDVPEWAKEAILTYTAWLYDNDKGYKEIYDSLIDVHRVIFNYAIND